MFTADAALKTFFVAYSFWYGFNCAPPFGFCGEKGISRAAREAECVDAFSKFLISKKTNYTSDVIVSA